MNVRSFIKHVSCFAAAASSHVQTGSCGTFTVGASQCNHVFCCLLEQLNIDFPASRPWWRVCWQTGDCYTFTDVPAPSVLRVKSETTCLNDKKRKKDANYTSFMALISNVRQLLQSYNRVSMETTGVCMFTRQGTNVWINNKCVRKKIEFESTSCF